MCFTRSMSLANRVDKDLKSIAQRALNGRIEDIWPPPSKQENALDSEARKQQHKQDQQMLMIPRLAAAFQIDQSQVSAQLLVALREEIRQLRLCRSLAPFTAYSMVTHCAGRAVQTPPSFKISSSRRTRCRGCTRGGCSRGGCSSSSKCSKNSS